MTLLGYALAVVIGLLLGLLGGGGAILTVPVLHYVMGYEIKTAIPMALVVVGLTAVFGALTHARRGGVDFRAAAAFGPPAILGSLLGADLGLRADPRLQLVVLAVALIGAALSMLRTAFQPPPPAMAVDAMTGEHARPARPIALITLVGGAVGVLTGFTGVGGGFLYVPALTLLGGLPIKRAIGTSLVLIFLGCAAGVVRYYGNLHIDWGAILRFTLLAGVGVAGGSALVPYVSHRALRRGFAIFLLLMGGFVLLRGR